MNFLTQAMLSPQSQQNSPALMTIPGQQVGETPQDADYSYQMPAWLYDAAGPNAIGQAQAAGSTAGFGGYGGAMTQSGNTIGGKNLYAARSPYQDMQGYTDGRNIYVRDPATPGAWLSYDASSPQAKAALQGKNSALNGTNYDVLDANGNVIGQRAFTGLKDQDHVNDVMMAVAGAALGGMAAFGGAAAGGAGAASGAGGAGAAGAAAPMTQFGVLDTGLGNLSAAGFGSAAAGAAAPMTQFGALDTGLGQMSASGFNAAPMTQFGVLDNNLANLSAQRGGFLSGAGGIPAGGGGGGSSGGSGGGTPPPANPNVSSSNPLMNPDGSVNWTSLATMGLGALGGSQGVNQSATSSRAMDPRMDALFYGSLAPQAQALTASQLPQAQAAGNQMMTVGSGLLGQTAPTTATNPYLKSIADDMQRRTQQMLDQNNLSIQGNAVSTGGLGGSRQGVAQGVAAGQAADSLQGNVAGLYGNAYNQDQTRLLQQQTLGAGLLGQGLNTAWQPIQNATQTYSPFTGFGTTTQNSSQGGGAMGAVGGALGAYGLGKQAGWW